MKHCIKKSEKNVMKPKRRGSMTSEETSNYTAEVLSRQCTKTLEKSLETKSKHAHPHNYLSQKTVISL